MFSALGQLAAGDISQEKKLLQLLSANHSAKLTLWVLSQWEKPAARLRLTTKCQSGQFILQCIVLMKQKS